ncbi:hypothetical protein EJ08DRAFT_581095 [Tothia fuscella]|uniref:Zn(2)-C6 fungal-type domain-containing protein n=1 Tax=Tothia fuscella TaxID=1048955 RepID=A0A9P4P0V4_9PEZI|nr:hypothetical protein EJ08DRAFT_581095 [Tothia fuscella]
MSAGPLGLDTSRPSPPAPPGPLKPTYAKRGRITIVACVYCRRRKTKCDGKRPICSQCQARDGRCFYDMNEEQRRLTYLRENVEQLSDQKSSLESLIQNLRVGTEEEAMEILRRLRGGTDPQSLAEHVQAGRYLAQRENSNSSQVTMAGDYSAREHIFGLTRVGTRTLPDNEIRAGRVPNAHSPLGSRAGWTVPAEPELVEHLLSLYFSWQHSFFQSFPEDLFRKDMVSGRTKFCSKLLMNGICAAGCLLSTRPEARRDPNDPLTAGTIFFDEGIYELRKTETPSIPSIAGLFVLSHVEGYRGRMSRMWDYSGRSARMALDLNLHLRSDRTSSDHLSPEAEIEEKARVHTFWGCFIADQIISFTLGRLPQIPTTAITVELPRISPEEDDMPWGPHGDKEEPLQPGARSTTFHEVAALSKIVNSTLLLFFAPQEVMRGSLLLEEFEKYKMWYARLPTIVSTTKDAPPHVISLHMYYHAAVLLLFRPFLKAKFTNNPLSPSEVCRSAAASISDLFSEHRKSFDTVGIYTFQLHCLLTACTIHIINVPAIASTAYLTKACDHFHDLAHWNEWATGSLTIIKGLVQKWSIILPGEADTALYRNTPDGLTDGNLDNASGHQTDVFRTSKRMAFLNPSSSVVPKRQKLAMPRLPGAAFLESGQMESDSDVELKDSKGKSTREQQSNFLFAPFPNQPAPLLEPIHTSMQPEVATETSVAEGFDGLSFDDGGGWFDPFMGYNSGP